MSSTVTRPARNLWIETPDGGFVGAAWYRPPEGVATRTAVLIVPGIAHEERTMCGGLAALAEALAGHGLTSLLIDLHGCSQSHGRLDRPDIGERWREDLRAALRHLRLAGFADVIVVGVRLGALLALDALGDQPLLGLVAWAPPASGRRHLRELKVLHGTGAVAGGSSAAGALAIGGFDIPEPVLAHIAHLDPARLGGVHSGALLLVDPSPQSHHGWTGPWSDRGVRVEQTVSRQADAWLFGGDARPPIPDQDIEAIAVWCARRHAGHGAGGAAPADLIGTPVVTFEHRGCAIRETFVEVGPVGLTAVLSEPVERRSPGGARLLMSTVGPGRTFTDFARDEAASGHVCLRFDFSGFGTSAVGASVRGGELYTDVGADDVTAAVEFLHQRGHERIYLLGFCAGAWSMLQAGALPGIAGAAAINVALYREPDPGAGEAPASVRQRMASWPAAWSRSSWLRRVASRIERASNAAARPVAWLETLCRAGVPVLLGYAEGDPGLLYLQRQLAQGLAARVGPRLQVTTYEGLGHLAEGSAARARLYRDIAAFFTELDRSVVSPDSRAPRPRRPAGHAPPVAADRWLSRPG